MELIVCPAASVGEIVARRQPSHVLRLMSPGRPRPPLLGPGRTLILAFNDIARPLPDLVAPDEAAIASILDFGRAWPGEAPLLVSCDLGVSRSTASAFAIACARRPDLPEAEIAARLRRACPYATPNPLVVALADTLLGRAGRMMAAIAALGRGVDYAPYPFFELGLNG